MKTVICTRNLWFGPTMSMGQRITNEINCDPEEVAKLRRALKHVEEGGICYTLSGEPRYHPPRVRRSK